MGKLLTVNDISIATGITLRQIQNNVCHLPGFPKPIKVGRKHFYDGNDVDYYLSIHSIDEIKDFIKIKNAEQRRISKGLEVKFKPIVENSGTFNNIGAQRFLFKNYIL